jgi:acetyl-CoA synthetase
MPPGEQAAWWPDEERIAAAAVTRLARRHGLAGADELLARSKDPEWFWDAVVADLGLEFRVPYTAVLDTSRGPEWATWFTGGMFALTDSCLRRWATEQPGEPAVIGVDETGRETIHTWAGLTDLTRQIATELRRDGVRPGDAVAVFLPMTAAYVATLYACAQLGAMALPLFTGFGADAIAVRLRDAGARAAVTTEGTIRRGQWSPLAPVLAAAAADPGGDGELLRTALVIGPPVGAGAGEASNQPIPPGWRHWQPGPHTPGTTTGDDPRGPAFPSEQPWLLAYTSGTTGSPKGAVLTQAGLLLGVARDAAYHVDLRRGDVLCWPADPGWIMGPWQVLAAGAVGATLLLLEGLPGYPTPDRLWNVLTSHNVAVFGCGPTLARSLAKAGSAPAPGSWPSLRAFTSTGEPSDPDSWDYLFRVIGEGRAPVINISGGTEVGGAFLAPLPTRPLKPCSVGGPTLGMDVGIVDRDGQPAAPGVTGELVCRSPWPSMTRGLLGAPERYLDSYWRRWPGVWAHGDWASRDEDGAWYVHGRSDETMNLAGKRTGPAEIETVLLSDPRVAEAAAFGVPDQAKGEALWCAVVPAAAGQDAAGQARAGRELAGELRQLVAARLGAAFRPGRVLIVPGLPRTRSGKVMRGLLRDLAAGRGAGDTSAMAEPALAGQIEALLPGLAAEPAPEAATRQTGSNPSDRT